MDVIFITVKIPGQNEMDLKIPDYITGEDFLAMLSETFGVKLPAHTKIQAEPIGRIAPIRCTVPAFLIAPKLLKRLSVLTIWMCF